MIPSSAKIAGLVTDLTNINDEEHAANLESERRRLRLKQTILKSELWECVAAAYELSDRDQSLIATDC